MPEGMAPENLTEKRHLDDVAMTTTFASLP
jgi:hypothetical protein